VDASPAFLAELLALKGVLRWYQNRLDEALDLANQAIAVFPPDGDQAQLAQHLAGRGLIQRRLGNFDAAISDNQTAQRMAAARGGSTHLRWVIAHNLSNTHLEKLEFAEAEASLAEARRLAHQLQGKLPHCYNLYLEARLHRLQGNRQLCLELLREARVGFLELRLFGDAAVVSIDLANLLAAEKATFEVGLLTDEAVPLLDTLKHLPQAKALKARLQQSRHEVAGLDLELLQALQEVLVNLKEDPTAQIN
jgi:tetratricopeptide (TPR) repeat protein